ncbi:hypothetical protein [Rathayibacter sp. SD072]|uniref:hypothetical protein n=1 Tax=Rathayibacter sp. SD072 TaxID=2781731 RepID=UPI001A95DD69|nr:hypothetical protein [Rathayibacter sp. SD072]MBO0984256.1 hypothetical protein [Rathayibacter sp. SD072]
MSTGPGGTVAHRRALLEDLIEASGIDGVDIATMFGAPAIRFQGVIVCFLGGDEHLVVKLTREETLALVGDGSALPVVMGRRTLREWVSVPRLAEERASLARWSPHVVRALSLARERAADPRV